MTPVPENRLWRKLMSSAQVKMSKSRNITEARTWTTVSKLFFCTRSWVFRDCVPFSGMSYLTSSIKTQKYTVNVNEFKSWPPIIKDELAQEWLRFFSITCLSFHNDSRISKKHSLIIQCQQMDVCSLMEEKGMTEDEMIGWHHRLDECEFEQVPGVGDGQGSLAFCSPRGRKE